MQKSDKLIFLYSFKSPVFTRNMSRTKLENKWFTKKIHCGPARERADQQESRKLDTDQPTGIKGSQLLLNISI